MERSSEDAPPSGEGRAAAAAPGEPRGGGEDGAQRADVPYRWPRGAEAVGSKPSSRARKFWIGMVVITSLVSLALLWLMLETRW